MIQNTVQRLLAICVLALMAATCCLAANNAALVGKWNMVSESEGDPVNWTLIIKDSDGKLSGFLAAGQSEQPAKDFAFSKGVLTFKAPYQSEDYDIELKLVGDKLDGNWSGGGFSGKTSGTKAQ